MSEQADSENAIVKELYNNGVQARYTTENFTYYTRQGSPCSIDISCATTAIGGRLVSENHDSTGVMLWPASHLMCQHLVQGDIILNPLGDGGLPHSSCNILELGCGCGLVSLVGILNGRNNDVWVATDIDPDALELCRRNFEVHHVNEKSGRGRIRSLKWGDRQHMEQVLAELHNFPRGRFLTSCRGVGMVEEVRFDVVVGADIVYPDTRSETLAALFETVETMLKTDGSFYLAFATRDGAKTSSRVLRAASDAGFAVERLPPLPSEKKRKLPPLLDSKLLVLRRSLNAREHNLEITGGEDCPIFPGLWRAVERLENPSSDEEWDPPFADEDVDW